MAPPAPVACSVPGCDYTTPANTPTWEIIRDFLQVHASTAHPAQAGAGPHHAPAPVSRPEIDLGANEADWRFFTDEFGRYKRSTGIDGQTVLDELWHCQTRALRTLMQAEDTANINTEVDVPAKIKSPAVVTLHSPGHLVQLRGVQQGAK